MSDTNPTQLDVGSKPGRRGGNLSTNRMRRGTANLNLLEDLNSNEDVLKLVAL
jgi:hypothetical protein